jgi:hypothetical protein
MKAIVMLILFCASMYGADTTTNRASDITNKVTVHELDGGKSRLRSETVYRGKTPILRVLRTTRDGVTKTSRSYEVGGSLVMIESDEDGDGHFESITLFRPGTDDLEMFTREPDGSVKPVSTRTLLATRKQFAAFGDFTDKLADKLIFQKEDLTDEQLDDLLRETRRKFQEAEKEKVDEN